MSVLNNSNAISTGGAYNITDSLRLRKSASAYLSRTFTTPTNNKIWTFSSWLKLSNIDTNTQLLSGGNTSSDQIWFSSVSKTLQIYINSTTVFNTNAVFRDPSAWYHIVVSVDTTQATASNRIKVYVNGVQQTSSSGTIAQNTNPKINSASNHTIGSYAASALEFLDGYLTEVNFIDGQALTPSDFGETNADGVWSPKEYTGTYGTNGFYLNFADKTDFKSFELDGTGDYISAPASEYSNYINGSGDFTIEWWVNYDALPSDGGWYAQDSGSAVVSPFNLFQQTNSWRLYATTANGTWNVFSNTLLATTSLTTNRWYHIACVRNGTTLTLYVDGVSQGTASIGTASLWTDTSHNLSLFNDWQSAGGGGGIDGTISNYRLVKGTAVYTSNFTPPTANLENISGTTILLARSTSTADLSGNITTTANGNLSLVDHLPPISSAIGDDVSGNDNHFATNNFDLTSTATTYDLMSDVPSLADEDTANFATLNPLNVIPYGSVSDGNLKFTGSATDWSGVYSSIKIPSTGKWYAECVVGSTTNNSNQIVFGFQTFQPLSYTVTNFYGHGHNSGFFLYNNGTASTNGGFATPAGTLLQIAIDADAGKAWYGYNNNWYDTYNTTNGNPSAGTNPYATGINFSTSDFYFVLRSYVNNGSVNFGQRPFKYTPPTGYKKLNTYNLPDSTIADGSQYMNPVLYTGNGTSQSITGVGFQPDLVWLKSRSNAFHHYLVDSIRGDSKYLRTSSTNAEATNVALTINSDGFSLDSTSDAEAVNNNASTYVAWNWRGSDSTAVSNTDGTITSTVSANPTSGFSVVTWTGNGANSTIGHGLGISPKFIIVKQRNAVRGWVCYNSNLASNQVIYLNVTNASNTDTTAFNATAPTSSVFTVGTSADTNQSGGSYVAYCFSNVEGFSKFGSYTGNGSADGPFIFTNFRPAFVMTKRTDSTSNWILTDTGRSPDNESHETLYANLSNAEVGMGKDLLSNGFKCRTTDANINASGGTYIYMCFSENPFKGSLAR